VRSPETCSREPQSPHPDSHRGVVTPAGCLVRLIPRRVPCPWLGRGGRAVLVRGNGAPPLASALPRAQGGMGCPPSPAPRSGYTRRQHGQACIPLPSPLPAARCSRRPWFGRPASRRGVVTPASGSARFAAAALCRARSATPPLRCPGTLANRPGFCVQLAHLATGFLLHLRAPARGISERWIPLVSVATSARRLEGF